MVKFLVIFLLVLISPINPLLAEDSSQTQKKQSLKYNFRARFGYFALNRDKRDGETIKRDNFRLRIQTGLDYHITPKLKVTGRISGRFANAQDQFKFLLNDYIPLGQTSINLGEATVDKLYVRYVLTPSLTMRAGRMQQTYKLASVPGKSLDRENSSSTNINWTDGVHLTWRFHENWNLHFTAQHNSAKGSSNVARQPLDFSSSNSRISYYTLVEKIKQLGGWHQLNFSFNYFPDALPLYGEPNEDLLDYYTLAGRASIRLLPLPLFNADLVVGGEAGYAFNTPSKVATKTSHDSTDMAGNTAMFLSANLMNMFEKHNIGVVIGWIEDGWLLSPNLVNNKFEREVRHQYYIKDKLSMETRIRFRDDLNKLVDYERKLSQMDLFIRLSYSL